ncbi:unnamed protein product, partial [Ectocarpus sp. 12 AP-2014]
RTRHSVWERVVSEVSHSFSERNWYHEVEGSVFLCQHQLVTKTKPELVPSPALENETAVSCRVLPPPSFHLLIPRVAPMPFRELRHRYVVTCAQVQEALDQLQAKQKRTTLTVAHRLTTI